MGEYLKSKNIEHAVLIVVVILSLSVTFNIYVGNSLMIMEDKNLYIIYLIGFFCFYIYMSIMNRKSYLKKLKVDKQCYYKLIDPKYKVMKVIHKYFAIFILVFMTLAQINTTIIPYKFWFYTMLTIILILWISTIVFSRIIRVKNL